MTSMSSTGLVRWVSGACAMVVAVMLIESCRHEPLLGPVIVEDGGGGVEEEEVVVCDSNIIWFQQQVLPILTSSCTNPGEGLNCHHTATDDNDDILIDSYQSLISSGILDPNDPFDSDLWESINDSDAEDRMPLGMPALSAADLLTIQLWLQQGAQNNSCEPSACDTVDVTYNGNIVPILQARCYSCHSGSTPSGNLNLTQWSAVNTVATNGTLEGAVRHLGDPFINMPPTGPRLSDCRIQQIQLWIAQGAPNN